MRTSRLLIAALSLLGVLWAAGSTGCGDNEGGSSGGGGAGSGRSPVLQASPNPIPGAAGAGTTTLSWRTGDDAEGHVYVSVDGRPEKRVAKGHRGKKEVDWIHPGKTYVFRLYKGETREAALASLTVTKGPKPLAPAGTQARPASRPAGATPPRATSTP